MHSHCLGRIGLRPAPFLLGILDVAICEKSPGGGRLDRHRRGAGDSELTGGPIATVIGKS